MFKAGQEACKRTWSELRHQPTPCGANSEAMSSSDGQRAASRRLEPACLPPRHSACARTTKLDCPGCGRSATRLSLFFRKSSRAMSKPVLALLTPTNAQGLYMCNVSNKTVLLKLRHAQISVNVKSHQGRWVHAGCARAAIPFLSRNLHLKSFAGERNRK